MLAELETYGIVLKPTENVLKDAVLERLLHELRRGSDDIVVETKSTNNNMAVTNAYDHYTAIAIDNISKLFIASLLFFSSYPWMTLWWLPPLYDYYRIKR